MKILFKRIILNIIIFLFLKSLVACSFGEKDSNSLLFFAAASTADVVREITDRFEAETQIPVDINLAASSTLAQQILAGARADLFLSANTRWVNELKNRGLIGKSSNLFGNSLVVIVPDKQSVSIQTIQDLTNNKISRISIADPEGVPAGIYAKQALSSLGLWNLLESKMVLGLDVRQVLFFVEQGEVQAGIVYKTDAAISKEVTPVLELNSNLSEPIWYPLVLMKFSKKRAEQFFEHIVSADSLRAFDKYGFSINRNNIPSTVKN